MSKLLNMLTQNQTTSSNVKAEFHAPTEPDVSPNLELPKNLFWIKIIDFFANALKTEVKFGHHFLWYPVALGLGAYFNLTRQENIPTIALIVPLVIIVVTTIIHRSKWFRFEFGYIKKLIMLFIIGAVCVNVNMVNNITLLDQDVTTIISGTVIARQFNENDVPRYHIRLDTTKAPALKRPPEYIQLVARQSHMPIEVGQYITGRARLTSPSGPVLPGGFDFAFHALTHKIGAYGYFYQAPNVGVERVESSLFQDGSIMIAHIRDTILLRIRDQLDGDAAGIAAALIVADRRAISTQSVKALRSAGLAHILAISGLHMVLAAGTLFISLRAILGLSSRLAQTYAVKKLAAMGAIGASSFYLMISGAPISAQRAWIMLLIMLVAILVDKPAITLRNVAVAAIIILLISPTAIVTPGFQMSFAAAAALVSVYASWNRLSQRSQIGLFKLSSNNLAIRMAKFILGLATTALIAGLATSIFSVQHFHNIASFGLLGNVLAMPIVTFIVMPMALMSVLLMPYGLEAMPLWCLGQAIEIVIVIAQYVSNLGGDINTGQLHPIAIGLLISGFIVFVLMRSKLRWAGPILIICGLIAAMIHRVQIPDILISEDGKLIAVKTSDNIVSINRQRPSSFVINQWQNAYRFEYIKPDRPLKTKLSKALLSNSPKTLWSDFEKHISQASNVFSCLNASFCAANIQNRRIVTISKRDYLNHACETADIIVSSVKLYGYNCSNQNVEIIEQEKLRRTGSIAINLKPNSTAMTYDYAVKNVVRPWTIQRYYNWQDKTFTLPNGKIIPQ